MDIKELEKIAVKMRIDVLKMTHKANSGHIGGSFSAAEMVAALYFGVVGGKKVMKYDAKKPDWDEQDYFILSKGHSAPALYTVLAMKGFFAMKELHTLRNFGAILRGHPISYATPGVEVCTGSLGQGLSQANGIALALKLDGNTDSRVYAMVGDGECQEGMVWEAAMTAAHRRIDNICVFVDNNGLQIDGFVNDIKRVESLTEKWKGFGCI